MNNTPNTYENHKPTLADAASYGHLMDYALDLHIITGPNGMCRCGEDGITCGQRLSAISQEIQSAIIGATMASPHN